MAILTPALRHWPQGLAVLWLGAVLLVAALAPILPLPYPPNSPDLANIAVAPRSAAGHWLGTDPQGRDVLSILVFGARTAVLLTLPAAVLSALLGALLGGAAGFWGNSTRLAVPYWLLGGGIAWWALQLPVPLLGIVVAVLGLVIALFFSARKQRLPTWPIPLNAVVMGAATTLDTIPRLVLVVAMAAGAGVSIPGLLALLTLTAWSHPARLVRAQMLRVRTLPFVEAAWAAGISPQRVWFRHALPHAIQPLRIALPLGVAGLLGLESTLSFLGIGLPPDVASWGRLMATIRNEPGAWWAFVFPASCLITSIISLITLSRYRTASEK